MKFGSIIHLTPLALLACACTDEIEPNKPAQPGDEVKFCVSLGDDSRTAYGTPGETAFPVYWVDGDLIQVASHNCSVPKAQYKLNTNGSTTQNYATSLEKTGAAGLQWGTATEADFYAIYPGEQAITLPNPTLAYAPLSISSTQYSGLRPGATPINGSYILEADMDNAIMYAQTFGVKSGENVDLRFIPYSTVLDIELNGPDTNVADQAASLYVQSVTLTAPDNQVVAGTFNLMYGSSGNPTPSLNAVHGTNSITVLTRRYSDATGTGGKDARSFLGFVNILPTARKGDEMKITVKTSDRTASFSVKLRVDFRQGYVYNFPLQLASYAGAEYGWTVVEKPAVRGTFTAATYNVDGLPNIAGINSNGPGSAGTTALGQKANSMGWDFLAVSEDFANNDQLVAALTNYSHGTWRGSITIWNSSKLNRADTDGLNFFWNNSTVTSEETKTWIQYQHEAGGLTSGANECIKKGFRYYLVTMKDGTEIDVYITHMNTSGDGGRNEAQNEQITEVVDYILAHDNGRPVIFMGDTNLRWTRHEIKTRLYDRINSLEGWSVHDPWIDFQWNGDYEGVTNHGKSIMAYGPNKDTNDETDDFGPTGQGYGYQKGEVVGKVFYINRTTNATQITATRYLCDTTFVKDNGDPLADHYPVVVEFAYKRTL